MYSKHEGGNEPEKKPEPVKTPAPPKVPQVDGLAIKEEEQEGAARTALLDDNASSFKQARAKQEDERMAEATTSRHKSNYIKISMVVLKVSPRAVQVQFDKEFLPVRLQSILNEYVFHLNDLKMKKRITQPQWNLLFPKTGVQPSSKNFDITLMIFLLRNLTSIDIMDNRLPSATDTSVGADLSRIKYYRNNIVHCTSDLLDDTDFESYWNDVTPAILRLGGISLKKECDDWYGRNVDAKQRDDGLKSTKAEKRLALVEEELEQFKIWIESDQEKSNPVPNNIRVPIIELKGHTFKVDDGKSVAIECNGFEFDEKRPLFWEWIHEDDKTKKLTIRENKKDKYLLNSDPPYLWIFNAEMSDRGYYHCCIEYSTSNGDEIARSKKAHLIVEKAVKPGNIHTNIHVERQFNINANNINADTINMDGDRTNLTVKNTDKKEQTYTFVGISSSSSSENATPENFDKIEKGRHNSDYGQEPGDVDIIKEKMSKMKPVSVTEQVDGLAIKKEKQEVRTATIEFLKKKLEEEGLHFRGSIPDDGNSFFKACSDQLQLLEISGHTHSELRQMVIPNLQLYTENEIKSANFTRDTWKIYIDKVAEDKENVNDFVVETMAKLLQRKIIIYWRSFNPFKEIFRTIINEDANGSPLRLAKDNLYYQSLEKRHGTPS